MADKYLLHEAKAKGDLVSCKAHREIQRGEFLELVQMEGNTAYTVKDASETTLRGNLVVNVAEIKMYDEKLSERDFSVKQDEMFRARNPKVHCVHVYHEALVEAGVVAGDFLKMGAGVLVKAATPEEAMATVEVVKVWKGQKSVQVRYL